jgi:hypothetical protein
MRLAAIGHNKVISTVPPESRGDVGRRTRHDCLVELRDGVTTRFRLITGRAPALWLLLVVGC